MEKKSYKVPVLMYHSIGRDNPYWIWNHLTTPVKIFEEQMNCLRKEGFNAISLQELYDYMMYNNSLPLNPIVLTFDDGYIDNWVYAYPLMKKYGMKGTIFINPSFVNPTEEYRPNLEDVWIGKCREEDLISKGFLSWGEMRGMEESGVVDIQSHSMTHDWYFMNNEIVDFHHPGDNYVLLAWIACPERKYMYLEENQDELVGYGTPVYSYGRSLGIKRYFEDKKLSEYLVNYVRENGYKAFFNDKDWRGRLYKVVAEYKKNNELNDRYETGGEFKKRVEYELAESKRIIEEKLNKRINFLCWPGAAFNKEVVKTAKEIGYISTTLYFDDKKIKNTFGGDPSEINRIDCASAVYWGDRVASYAGIGFFMANIKYFRGSKIYLCVKRFYQIKYMLPFIVRRILRGKNIQ